MNNPAPAIPVISASGSDLVCTEATTYQWYRNGNLIEGATEQIFQPEEDGIYVVRITDVPGCVYRYSAGYHYTLNTGLSINENHNLLKIYPNPANDHIFIESPSLEIELIRIHDLSGKLLYTGVKSDKVDISDLEPGMYVLSIVSGSRAYTRKILVSK